jgi:hypothetical protein
LAGQFVTFSNSLTLEFIINEQKKNERIKNNLVSIWQGFLALVAIACSVLADPIVGYFGHGQTAGLSRYRSGLFFRNNFPGEFTVLNNNSAEGNLNISFPDIVKLSIYISGDDI